MPIATVNREKQPKMKSVFRDFSSIVAPGAMALCRAN
jgi:hypothetical protein